MARPRIHKGDEGGIYFPPPSKVERFSSGCSVLDCVLGGGWAQGRVLNVVGDKSTGKTLLAIEAAANFVYKNPRGDVYYNEVEAAFDRDYAETLGLPKRNVDLIATPEIEGVFEHLFDVVLKKDKPGLYVIDSLDALTDRAETERKIDEGSYGATKAKKLSELFRRLVRDLNGKNVTVMVISQVRDNIGVTFGETLYRAGGRALDFYSSQVIWLSQISILKKTKTGIERPIGINVRAKCKKNKVGPPFRDCEFPIAFSFGIDDVKAGLTWLLSVERLDLLDLKDKKAADRWYRDLLDVSDEQYQVARVDVADAVREAWEEIEKMFAPTRRKYSEPE